MYFSKLDSKLIDSIALQSLNETLNSFKPGIAIDATNFDAYKKSINFLNGAFAEFFEIGKEYSCVESEYCFEMLRQKGRIIENKLINITDGIHTHLGAMFSLGLMCAAVGRLDALGLDFELDYLIATIAAFTKNYSYKSFINIDLKTSPLSIGEELYKKSGLTTIRGLAERGFEQVLIEGLRYLQTDLKAGDLHSGLFLLMISLADDSGIIFKHGIDVLNKIKNRAHSIAVNFNIDNAKEFDADLLNSKIEPRAAMGLHSLCLFTKKLLDIKNNN